MNARKSQKTKRHELLLNMVEEDPFNTDEELSEKLSVSVPTIRLDRVELSIPELRERVMRLASENHMKVKSMSGSDIVGQIIDIELNNYGVSVLETDDSMAFERTKIIRGQIIYAFAESLAMAVINEDAALVGVANIKYTRPVYSGTRLIARCELREIKVVSDKRYLVWIKIFNKETEVFRGKFTLISV
ncbi:MAG: transcription factor FapR [Oscillospiraceae bacterium]|nr:transcription factor FapR [Oscillospiraceae bacterium]